MSQNPGLLPLYFLTCVLPAGMCVQYIYSVSARAWRGCQIPGTCSYGCELLYGCWESNPNPEFMVSAGLFMKMSGVEEPHTGLKSMAVGVGLFKREDEPGRDALRAAPSVGLHCRGLYSFLCSCHYTVPAATDRCFLLFLLPGGVS